MDTEQLMSDTMRRHMPGIKTQAQYDAVMAALDATRLVLNSILEQKLTQEAEAMQLLNAAFQVAKKATELQEKLSEVPTEATSSAADPFRNPPTQFEDNPEIQELQRHPQFNEVEMQAALMNHLETIETWDQLTAWYASTKKDRDQVKTQSLRNELLDAIRAKKNEWCVQCRNPHFDGGCECGKA